MNRQLTLRLALAVLTVTLLMSGLSFARGQSANASAFTLDGGGGTSSGGEYEITGSIGQMELGSVMSGGDFEVSGEFLAMMVTVPGPDGTALTISVTPQNLVVLSWASDGTDLVLQQSSNLSAPNWTVVGITPADDGLTKSVTLPLTMGNKFFRLTKP